MQGLAPPDFSSSQRTSAPTADRGSAEQTPHTATPEDGVSVTSSPAGDNHNTLADISAQFRLLELDGSADSLDQVDMFPCYLRFSRPSGMLGCVIR
jgi:hypothetical protein